MTPKWVIKALKRTVPLTNGLAGQYFRKKSNASGDTEWVDLPTGGGYDGNPATIQQTANYRLHTDTQATTWNGKAEGNHSHNEYAPSNHSHDYAASNHNHNGIYQPAGSYAPAAHSHSEYALSSHNHDLNYAAANHNHSGLYAALVHSHSEYAVTAHNHDTVYERKHPVNFSVADQTINAATSALLAGSVITIPATKIQIGSIFKFQLCLSKTAAGTAANTFIVRLGVNGTIADAAILTFTMPVGTAAIDTGEIDITITIRGPLTASCIAQGALRLKHNLATTGLANVPGVCLKVTSGAFNPTLDNLKISVSCTTAASTVLTFQQVIGEGINI